MTFWFQLEDSHRDAFWNPKYMINHLESRTLIFQKSCFYFMLKVLFILEIFTFLYHIFGYVEKRLDKKAMVNFKIYDITNWITNICNIHTA